MQRVAPRPQPQRNEMKESHHRLRSDDRRQDRPAPDTCVSPAASRATCRSRVTSRLDTGARLEGHVKASVVVVVGELIGNIENAKRVELLESGVINGDVKAGSLTVAAGSRMRGQVEFGYEGEARAAKTETKGFGNA